MRVRRRLLHWRPRWRGKRVDLDASPPDVGGGGGGGGGGGFSFLDLLDDFFVGIAVIALAIVLVMAVVPALVLVVEVLVVALFATFGFLGRALLGRPWTVEAVERGTGIDLATWEVRGFRRAGAAARAIEAHLASGGDLPTDAEVAALHDTTTDTAEPTWPST